MRTRSAATGLLDHVNGWRKIYSDDAATIHIRVMDPAISPTAP